MVIPYEQDLFRKLEGPQDMRRREEKRGDNVFVLRFNPEHIRRTTHERSVRDSERRMEYLNRQDHRNRALARLEDEALANDVRVS